MKEIRPNRNQILTSSNDVGYYSRHDTSEVVLYYLHLHPRTSSPFHGEILHSGPILISQPGVGCEASGVLDLL